ncbi:MAG: response regulator, partial [Bacteroides sp.]
INERENKKITQLAISVNVNKLSDNQIQFFSDKVYLYDTNKKTYSEAILKGNSTIPLSGLQLISSNEYVTYVFGERNIFELNNRTKVMNTIFTLTEPNSIITSVTRDKNSNFWIGTTEGLITYNTLTYETKKIKTNLFSNVSSVKYDKNNRIWIGTQGMLFCYIIKKDKFVLLGESDGAFSNEYLPRPTLQSKSGDIYMGGVMGLVRINKDILFEDAPQPTIVLTDVLLNGVPVNPSDIINASLSIPWSHTSLGIKVMAREEDVFREKLFKYSVVGLNNQYFETYEHSLTLYTLPSGNYEIMVSCNTKDGSWSIPMKILSLSVTPPWWKSAWFITFLILFTIGCIALTIRYVIRFKERKLKWEMKEHEQKTYEEKVRFLINISHELRTPLTLIYAPLKRMLKEEIKDEKLVAQLNGIYKQTRQMKSIINMVLDVRKMEVGEDSLHLLPHPLNQWLSAIADDFIDEFKAKNIQLLYDFDTSLEEVSFDEDKCEIVISNLLMNALKFSDSNTSITLSTKKTSNKVRISIKDQGIGLGGIDTSKLFTRFYQGNHDRQGSGIGLSYAKMLVEMHGGNIGAISNEDKGSTFYFELPLTNATVDLSYQPKPYLNELLYSPEEEEITTNDFSTKEYTLLVVEDEPELREFLRETLSEYFKQVYTAENGVVALTVINQASPSIVISDVMMPKMNGFELCKNIKKNIEISHIPVILLTARNDSGSTSLGYKMGADAYLAKPFDTEFLMILIRNQLKNREQMKARYKNFGLTIDPKEISFSSADEKFLLKFNNLIVNNISNMNLDVQFVADNIGMSRASLYKKTKVLTNMTVSDYINKYRIEKAMQLVLSDVNLATIAEQTGFGSQRYFSTLFKQATGITPTQYRESHKA